MKWISNIFSNGASELIKSAGSVVSKFITTDKDRDAAMLELEKVTQQSIYQMEQLALSKTQMYLDDVNSARDLTAKSLKSKDPVVRRFPYYFAWFWSIMSVGYLFAATFILVPQENETNAKFILGFLLGTIISTIIGFFYGSKENTDIDTSPLKNIDNETR